MATIEGVAAVSRYVAVRDAVTDLMGAHKAFEILDAVYRVLQDRWDAMRPAAADPMLEPWRSQMREAMCAICWTSTASNADGTGAHVRAPA
jgi:hypothetical protein